jgi:hypothetical protein
VDKVPGSLETSVINSNSLRDILPTSPAPARCAEVTTEVTQTVAPKPAKPGGLFKAFSTPRIAARPVTRPDAGGMEAMDLPYTLREDIAEIGRMSASTPISPAKADLPDRLSPSQPPGGIRRHGLGRIAGAQRHSQAAEEGHRARPAQHRPTETLVHALDATSQDLPGRYIVPRKALSCSRMPKARSTGAASSLAMAPGQGRGGNWPRS